MKEFFASVCHLMSDNVVATIFIFIAFALIIALPHLFCLLFNRISFGIKPTKSQLKASKKYKRVIIFGIDGAGNYFNKCDAKNFKRIYENGSVTYKATSQYPTISAQNWTSMLHGVSFLKHKVTNEVASSKRFTDDTIPSIFKVCRKEQPDSVLASIVNWSPINYGSIEEGLNVDKIDAGNYFNDKVPHTEEETDIKVKNIALDYLDKHNPTILFLHLDCVDHAGHNKGYASDYFEKNTLLCDELIGEIYDKYVQNGWEKDTLFITVTDHGHKFKGGHGGNTKTERFVTFAVAGGQDNIIKGTPSKTCVQDIASVVLFALGIEQPKSYTSRVPKNMFIDL